MKKYVVSCVLCLIFGAASAAHALDPVPNLSFQQKMSAGDAAYLGVSSESFSLTDIKSDYLFIQAFSMYCPVCQRDAPHINEVFTAFAGNPKIKFMGIGLGNNDFEINVYKKKYGVKFPLLNDAEYASHEALGEVGTPTYYVVKITAGRVETLHAQQGESKDIAGLIALIHDVTGVQ